MHRSLLLLFLLPAWLPGTGQPKAYHNLQFDSLASRWDEGLPVGNGWLGAIVWKKQQQLRVSLDRVDLWDDRPMPSINKLKFDWMVEQVRKKDYDTVQKLGDWPYENYPAPTKIPGAALEFDLAKIGTITSSQLDISMGLATVHFDNGAIFNLYIHAKNQVGYFGFENFSAVGLIPALIIPNYHSGSDGKSGNSVEGQGLERLGYAQGVVKMTANSILYHQPGWGGNYYEVLVKWFMFPGNHMIGEWTITNNKKATLPDLDIKSKEPTGWNSHVQWWKDFWDRSSITLPDSIVEKQYYLEMYKFGSVARANTPPISLQAIWTADNGNLPPWKGDFHHDLNTELSYWPGYASNHLDLTSSYTTWLWKVRKENIRWTKACFGLPGLNIPGVTTISGKPMGGWVQYSVSPTTAAWVSQHFYWQWKYSMDDHFLKSVCAPYMKLVSQYLAGILREKDADHKLKLPLSSSPEIHDNSINAWFNRFTNYDLALVKSFYSEIAEVVSKADTGGKQSFNMQLKELPGFAVNETGLEIAPGENLESSHRHHSPYMAIYPLGLLNVDQERDKEIVVRSLRHIEEKGTDQWCGYSFSWMACLYARAGEANNALKQLKIFATAFCSTNSFHLNGDQSENHYSSFTYRPFTLEGNFAFAQGVHELLLQSRKDYVEVFPAIPEEWKNVSFRNLRAEGAFLITAKKENGRFASVQLIAEKGGPCRLKLPFKNFLVRGIHRKEIIFAGDGIISFTTRPGQVIHFDPQTGEVNR